MRVLLLSNINMQPLVGPLKPWEVTCGEFNSILLDLSNPSSAASSNDFSHIACLFDSDVMMGDAFYGDGAPEQCESFLAVLETFCGANPEKVVIANLFCMGTGRWLTYADPMHPLSLKQYEVRLNERLIAIARTNRNLLLVDIELLFKRHGEAALLSSSFWYLGRIRYSNLMFRSLATMLQQAMDAYTHRSKKVLVLDLDNTLWGGVVGETGPLGIALSEDGVGRCYRDFQRAVKAIQRSGVLLAICSKNNPADVDEVFERNPMMVLRREDFVSIRANWETKPENLLCIADQLNLGADSFVLIDDNAVERDLVRTAVPGITVPEFPDRVENLPSWLLHDIAPAWFGRYTLTAEDESKTSQYRVNEERQKHSRSLDLDTYLQSLQIECTLRVDPIEQILRIAQMTQKTNQFNLTTRRYDVTDIQRFLASPDHAVVLLEYKDRFGSEGAVGLAIADFAKMRIDSFLMSCRVIGRKVEDHIMQKIVALFQARGSKTIFAEFIPTKKNQQVADFYEAHGFILVREEPDGHKNYERIIG